MVAWMDRAAAHPGDRPRLLLLTIAQGGVDEGESSGHLQVLREVRIDCDGDVVLLKVDQLGGIACHTGRRNCFFRRLDNGDWVSQFEPIKSETEIYGER